jgi:uncharacterized damage-inducible protein DinB
MIVSMEFLRTGLEYTAWAAGRLIDAVSPLSPEQLNRDFATADKSVLGTLVHNFGVDRAWLKFLTVGLAEPLVEESEKNLDFLRGAWPAVFDGWRAYLARFDDATTAVGGRGRKGNEFNAPLWQVVLHLVNHGTHHRGQISGFLRALGTTPPPLDFLYFCRPPKA